MRLSSSASQLAPKQNPLLQHHLYSQGLTQRTPLGPAIAYPARSAGHAWKGWFPVCVPVSLLRRNPLTGSQLPSPPCQLITLHCIFLSFSNEASLLSIMILSGSYYNTLRSKKNIVRTAHATLNSKECRKRASATLTTALNPPFLISLRVHMWHSSKAIPYWRTWLQSPVSVLMNCTRTHLT